MRASNDNGPHLGEVTLSTHGIRQDLLRAFNAPDGMHEMLRVVMREINEQDKHLGEKK